jgi:hypothetical protein
MASAPPILIELKFLLTYPAPVSDYRCVANADATAAIVERDGPPSPSTTTIDAATAAIIRVAPEGAGSEVVCRGFIRQCEASPDLLVFSSGSGALLTTSCRRTAP